MIKETISADIIKGKHISEPKTAETDWRMYLFSLEAGEIKSLLKIGPSEFLRTLLSFTREHLKVYSRQSPGLQSGSATPFTCFSNCICDTRIPMAPLPQMLLPERSCLHFLFGRKRYSKAKKKKKNEQPSLYP